MSMRNLRICPTQAFTDLSEEPERSWYGLQGFHAAAITAPEKKSNQKSGSPIAKSDRFVLLEQTMWMRAEAQGAEKQAVRTKLQRE